MSLNFFYLIIFGSLDRRSYKNLFKYGLCYTYEVIKVCIMEIIKYILLGLIQGITEIFPISSSGHLVLFQRLFGLNEPGLVFEMFTNTASFLALFVLFYKDIFRLIQGFFGYLFSKEKQKYQDDFVYVMKLLIAIVPIGIVGFAFKDTMGSIKNLLTVGISLMVTGTLLLTIFFTRHAIVDHDEITFKDALLIGFTQAFAIFPGISRSGSTIIGGRSSRVSLKSILKFSFLAYIIISVPTSILGFYDLSKVTVIINWLGYSLAFVMTFLTTFLTGYLVMKKLKVDHMLYFGIYCFFVGLVSLLTFFL